MSGHNGKEATARPDKSTLRAEGGGDRSRWVPWFLLCGCIAVLLALTAALDEQRDEGLKLALAGFLSFLPGWIYLQFIKNRGRSLYDEYVLNLFRLRIDKPCNLPMPPKHTDYYPGWEAAHGRLASGTKDNLYRRKFESIYGKNAVSTLEAIGPAGVKERTEAFFPVIIATLVMSIGWILALEVQGGLTDFEPSVPGEALAFGFLGAYAFILQDLTRRYFRDDLKTGAYIAATTRVIFVVLIILAFDRVQAGSGNAENVAAFLIGFFPQAGLQALQALVAKPLRRLLQRRRRQVGRLHGAPHRRRGALHIQAAEAALTAAAQLSRS